MAGVTIRLEGARELHRELKKLERKAATKISRKALRDGAKVILKETKSAAPKRSGLLQRSLKVKAGKRKKDTVRFRVQTAGGDYKGEAFYGAFVEYGHKAGSRKLGAKRRDVKPNPYMGPAFEKSKEKAARVIVESIKHGLALGGGKVVRTGGFTGKKF